MLALTSAVDSEMNERNYRNMLGPGWQETFKRLNTLYFHDITIKFDTDRDRNLARFSAVLIKGPAKLAYGAIQALVRAVATRRFSDRIAEILKQEQSAYRLFDGHTLIPVGSSIEADTISRAYYDAEQAGLNGARKHLSSAAASLSEGNYADSVRERVHAIESTLCKLTGQPSVSKALNKLSENRQLHETFKRGINQLYGYGSDEPGERHPLLDKGDAAVTEQDALFMLGVCASLVTYFARGFGRA